MSTPIIQQVKSSGKYPPSLFRDEPRDTTFETALAKVVDPNGFSLTAGSQLEGDFKTLIEMAGKPDNSWGDKDTLGSMLAQRRSVILAVVGATPSSSSAFAHIMRAGFVRSTKAWLDDILSGSVGGVDLLLHLLSNITLLPVSRSDIKDTGMGKAIGSVEKHRICAGTPNESAIKQRVQQVMDAWKKSVKVNKDKVSPTPVVAKRELETEQSSPVAKKARTEDTKKSSLFSLLNKVKSESDPIANKVTTTIPKIPTTNPSSHASSPRTELAKREKKSSKRVKWQDHFGGDLTASRTIEGLDHEGADQSVGSWSDQRQRDRLREKELLSKVKKSKLLLDDDDDDLGMGMSITTEMPTSSTRTIPPTTAWTSPLPLPERADAPPPQVSSPEVANQTSRMAGVAKARMAGVAKARYATEFNVPASPAPMTDVEQALDMTNQSSTVAQSIPFFVPQQVPEPVPAAPAPAPSYAPPVGGTNGGWGSQQQGSYGHGGNTATPEYVQSLGLPMFLVGQDMQALQTLASTPSLLGTFVDANGMYDQVRLTNLVQTLSGSSQPPAAPVSGNSGYQPTQSYGQTNQTPFGGAPSNHGMYGPASGAYGGGGGLQSGMGNGYRGEQNNGDGNLHLSGYGPSTTQTEIINLFSPYVQVDEVVMKGNFTFVNTSDAQGAKRAREALSGALLGGAPIRINMAQRKKRDEGPPMGGASMYGNGRPPNAGFPPGPPVNQGGFPPAGGAPPGVPPGAPPQAMGGDVSQVRDDRGNPATKNLFVAGYGQGTSEQQLREVFGQYAQIVGIIMKNNFSFVNTSDRVAAVRARELLSVRARELLSGSMVNGGVLRINFAKESGRLGTSFDVTYNSGGGGGGGGGAPHSHYGRSY
eukprot:Nitzschia sp. Nitz4//scaffold166_size90379//25909//29671//NITZ4_005051-RA/size90379-augustus-gene-0.1-mRNA-1//1//CDS//3329538178//5092//frame0